MHSKLELRHLRLLVTVADEGGMTKAADRLHLTQSALSHQLRDAEERVGAQLFSRVGKRLVLTPAGNKLLLTARSLLSELHRAESELHEDGGVLRISMECYTCYHWLPAALARMREVAPRLEIQIDLPATANPLEALVEGKIDLAILGFSRLPGNQVQEIAIFSDELRLVLPSGHRLASKRTILPEELAGEDLVIYPPLAESYLFKAVKAAGVLPGRVFEVPLTEGIIHMVQGGMGVGLLARWAVAPYVAQGAIVDRRLGARGYMRQWRAAMLAERKLTTPVRHFIDLLRAVPAAALLAPEDDYDSAALIAT